MLREVVTNLLRRICNLVLNHDRLTGHSILLHSLGLATALGTVGVIHVGVAGSADPTHALKPKETFTDCALCPEMVIVPAGSFKMGSPENEKHRFSNEGPEHAVTFARQFAVGKFAVTFDEWDACLLEGGCFVRPSDEGWGRGRRPVINVSWYDTRDYAAWLSRKTGHTYRLLSEAEREYVSRAGAITPFWWGPSIAASQANYDGEFTYGNGLPGEFRQQTMPVDAFQPNNWGLFQVHGNVWEWTEDCFRDSYIAAPADGSPWTLGRDCNRRVARGGGWDSSPGELRAARADIRNSPVVRTNDVGFRVARAVLP